MRPWSMLALVAVAACATSEPAITDSGEGSDPGPGPDDQEVATEIPEALRALSPDDWWLPPADASNQFADSPQAALLGQRLFFDSGFSGPLLDSDNDGTSGALGYVGETGKVSCASCHVPEDAFSDTRSHGREISLAAGWGTRKTPSLLNVGHERILMWDGRRDALYNQLFGALEASFELNGSRLHAAHRMFTEYRDEYEAIFGPMPDMTDGERFPALAAADAGCDGLSDDAVCHGKPGDGAEFDGMSPDDQDAVTEIVVNMGKALAAYQRLLTCGPGRFDDWIRGDETALTDEEKQGADLFVGKAGCVSCHGGPLMTDGQFHNVGLKPAPVAYGFVDAGDMGASEGLAQALSDELNVEGPFSDGDDGRLPDTLSESLVGAFRTPSLRCTSMRPSFMHTGQLHSLAGVVEFFDRGGDASGYPGHSVLEPLGLSDDEKAALVAFLKALDGALPAEPLLVPPP